MEQETTEAWVPAQGMVERGNVGSSYMQCCEIVVAWWNIVPRQGGLGGHSVNKELERDVGSTTNPPRPRPARTL
jgi:hypothetical protein